MGYREFKRDLYNGNLFEGVREMCIRDRYTPNSQEELRRLDYRMKWEDDFRAYLKKQMYIRDSYYVFRRIGRDFMKCTFRINYRP